MDIEDRTGLPIETREYEEAIGVITRMLPRMMALPPELAVQLLNIKRCLEQGMVLTARAESELRAEVNP
jgi:hypothetical protein